MTEQEAEEFIEKVLGELQLREPASVVRVVSISGFRWVIENANPKSMIKLERRLQELTKRPIDLRLESKEDKNKRVERTGRSVDRV